MGRVFKIRTFTRSMKKTGLTDEALCSAVEEMNQRLVDAVTWGGVAKTRVALAAGDIVEICDGDDKA